MIKSNKIVFGLLLSMSFWMFSCESFLSENPESFLSEQNFFQNEGEAKQALMGAYDALGPSLGAYMKRDFQYMIWFASDAMKPERGLTGRQDLHNFTYSADQPNILDVWNNMYQAINAANLVIQNVPNISMDEAQKQQIIGEARFLRALNYFNGVRLWGDLPLMTESVETPTEAEVGRSPINDIYSLIIEDLQFAAENIPAKTDPGRTTSGAAKGLLAKVYLTRASSEVAGNNDYQRCAELSQEVINMPEHELMADYNNAIGAEPNDEWSKERLFEIQADRQLAPIAELSIFGFFMIPRGIFGVVPGEGNTGHSNIVSEIHYFNKFDERDYRREVTFIFEGENEDGEIIPWQEFQFPYPHPQYKYINTEATTRAQHGFSGNFVVLRLADVYLMRAECLNEMNGPTPEAYEMINTIRERARNRDGTSTSNFPPDLSGLTQEQFRDSVLHERAIELSYEGHRWFDLVRTDRLIETINDVNPDFPISEKHRLFPIPSDQMEANSKLTQNPGW